MLIIPVDSTSWFTEGITLEDVRYNFTFYWNVRDAAWYLDVFNQDLQTRVSGLKLVLNYDVLAQYPGRGLPPGRLLVLDVTENETPIAYDDLTNGRCQVVYDASV